MRQSLMPVIDPVMFHNEFRLFKQHVFDKSRLDFISFNSNPYTEEEEGYKYDIHREGRLKLDFGTWTRESIGQGRIAGSVVRAVELPQNNLVTWQARYGPRKRPHHVLLDAMGSSTRIADFESVLFRLYCTNEDEEAFNDLLKLFGRKYPLIAYLCFLKDRSRYMPIAPNYFDRSFNLLGADFVTSGQCSWENYTTFNGLLAELRVMLSQELSGEVSLLDSHSFAWMLSCQMGKLDRSNFTEYTGLSQKEKETIIQARIGQGRFRKAVLDYWSSCSATGCTEQTLLVASHIKPWAACDLREAVDVYNGLLLVPSLDAAFDAGYISFTDDGRVIVSEDLSDSDAETLGIRSDMRLCRTDLRHHPYLKYHRDKKFRKADKS